MAALDRLERSLASFPSVEVVGKAVHPAQALSLVQSLKPNVLCLDVDHRALDLVTQIMEISPRPILLLSDQAPASRVFPLLDAGALDVATKPYRDDDVQKLVQKIRLLSGVFVFHRPTGKPAAPAKKSSERPSVIVIGASTGGPQALEVILAGLSPRIACPILCVQHISTGFLDGMVTWLQSRCRLLVRVASHGEEIRPGNVYFAPDGYQLTLDAGGRINCLNSEPFDGHCPSVTVTMQSAVRHFGSRTVGVLLTGMGKDGVEGLSDIVAAGGYTIAQDEASSVVFGMPGTAVARGVVKIVLPLPEIGPALSRMVGDQK